MTSTARIAVIGAGPGGLATAAHLSRLGMAPVLINRSADRISPLLDRPEIRADGIWQGAYALAGASTDFARASSVDLVVVTTPATAHAEVARSLAPHLDAHHVVLLHPGRTLGALEFHLELQRLGVQIRAVAETDTLLYTARSPEPGRVRVSGLKARLQVAAIPPWHAGEAVGLLRRLGRVVPVPNVLVTGVHNIGAMFHPAPMVLNAGRIQSGRSFEYYREGITPAVALLVRGIDMERLAIARAWGISAEPVEAWMRTRYRLPSALGRLEDLVAANPAYRGVMAPATLQHRYLLEDVPTGLVPLAELGRLVGIRTPLMDAVTDMASALVGADLRAGARTLARWQMSSFGARDLRELISVGAEAGTMALASAQ